MSLYRMLLVLFLASTLSSCTSHDADDFASDTNQIALAEFSKIHQSPFRLCPGTPSHQEGYYAGIVHLAQRKNSLSEPAEDMSLPAQHPDVAQFRFQDSAPSIKIERIRVSQSQRDDGLLSAFVLIELAKEYRVFQANEHLWSEWRKETSTVHDGMIPFSKFILLHRRDSWSILDEHFTPREESILQALPCSRIPSEK